MVDTDPGANVYNAVEVFGPSAKKMISDIRSWIDKLDCSKIGHVHHTSKLLSLEAVKAIENAALSIHEHNKATQTESIIIDRISPELVFKAGL